MPNVITVVDRIRGCGKRKPGGLYLRCEGNGRGCGKLPLPLTVCPCCSAGVKPSRGWTWVDADKLFADTVCRNEIQDPNAAPVIHHMGCEGCPLAQPLGRAGLLWIGEGFYKTPQDWLNEASEMGISRRVAHIPKEFEIGKTWILAAHRKAIRISRANGAVEYSPGIFQVFQPSRIEYVVKGTESPANLEAMEARGITLVKITYEDSFL